MTTTQLMTTINIGSSDMTDAGEVRISRRDGNFRLKCTVPRCGWTARTKFWHQAQERGFAHAGEHTFGN